MSDFDVYEFNRTAWNREVESGNKWTVPVSAEEVARARAGTVEVLLTPHTRVPARWLGDLAGRDLLGLACGGGQQSALFAAAGARVTILDASDGQLGRDREVAEREGLEIATVRGDMAALPFDDDSFDIVFNPCSTCFVPDVRAVYREASRVLRPGGVFMTGFNKPFLYSLDFELFEKGICQFRYEIPFSDLHDLTAEERAAWCEDGPLEFSHTLTDLVAGQLDAGLVLTDLFEDTGDHPLAKYMPGFIATRAVKA